MKNTLDYYLSLHYQISLVQRDDGSYFATHPELPGCMAEGQSVTEAVAYLADAKEAWIETRLSGGYDVPEPAAEEEYSGKLLLRMSPRLHAGLSEAAAKEHISINQLITSALSEYLSGMRLYEKISDRLNKMGEEMRSEISSVVPALQEAMPYGVSRAATAVTDQVFRRTQKTMRVKKKVRVRRKNPSSTLRAVQPPAGKL